MHPTPRGCLLDAGSPPRPWRDGRQRTDIQRVTQRSLIVFGLFAVGLTFGAVVGRWSMPAPASASPATGERAAEESPTPTPASRVERQDAGDAGEDASATDPLISREVTATMFEVTRVIDGDTFRVLYDGDLTSVRLLDIDAPERGDPRAEAATTELRRLVDGQTVRLEFGPGRKRDGFGRLLCRVYVDELDVGQHLLDAGLVEPYRPGPRRSKTP